MKRTGRITLLIALLMIAATAFSACGSTFDAALYVKGNLDAAFHNEFDEEFLSMLDDGTTEESLKQETAGIIDTEVTSITDAFSITDPTPETTANLQKMFTDLFAQTKYEVGEVTEADGNYTVNVTVYPLTTLKTVSADESGTLQAAVTEKATADMTEAQIYEMVLNEMVTQVEAGLANPVYGDAQTMTVTIYQDENGYYTISDEEMSALGASLLEV